MALDIPAAVNYNRTHAHSVGWAARRTEVVDFLQREFVPVGPHLPPSDREFAELVALWQEGENRRARRQVLRVDGKLGPNSWRALQSDLARVAAGRTQKHLDIHISTLNPPRFDYNAALRFALDLYGSIGIQLRIRTEICPALDAADATRLSVINGDCRWNQFNTEQDDLYERAGIRAGASGVRVFFVAGLVELDGGSLKGCAGHAPGKPACVIDSNIATMFTLSHELGHVLLTSSFSPVHHPSNNNIMFRVTDGHTLSRPPVFDAAQTTQIRSNALLR
ncbi:MAG: hypothetical protein AcusKO_04870 [Acuticoccus sp.]